MKSNLLTKVFGSLALAGALVVPIGSRAGDYVQEHRWGLLGAGHTTTYTHTEPGIVGYHTQRSVYRDGCCRHVEITRTPIYGEVVTSKCKTSHVHWNQSVVAIPGKILTGIGKALTPPSTCAPVTCMPKPVTTCAPTTCAPKPKTCTPAISAPVYDNITNPKSREQTPILALPKPIPSQEF